MKQTDLNLDLSNRRMRKRMFLDVDGGYLAEPTRKRSGRTALTIDF